MKEEERLRGIYDSLNDILLQKYERHEFENKMKPILNALDS
jgi:hypothetical protein